MKIAVVGDVIVDEYVYGTASRLSPEAPVPIINFSRKETCAGGAQNVYSNIKSLTDNVVMCSTSDNPPIKTRIIADGHYIARIDSEGHDHDWKMTDEYLSADLVIASDYNKGALVGFNYTTRTTIVDPKQLLSVYRGVWTMKPNAKEFAAYCGSWDNGSQLLQKMVQARLALSIEHLIVTLGDQGVAYVGPGSNCRHIFPSQAQEVFDVTGAGDTFTAVLAYGISIGLSMLDSIELANKGAAVAVSHHGTYVIKPHDIKPQDIVFTNGCFDILHPGHISYLKQSKQLGSRLVVGLNSDTSVRSLKGDSRPINTQDHRKIMLEALSFVDEVIIFDEPTPIELIKTIKPSIITKGGDYAPEDVVGFGLAKVIIVPMVHGHSSTGIIERIRS